MASKQTTQKVAYDFDLQAKRKLAIFKAELRAKGIPATETGILEMLVDEARLEPLARAYRRRLGI